MQNFDYQTPTRLIFGKGVISALPEVMKPLGQKILLTYGGGSIKKLGLYDKVRNFLKSLKFTSLQTFSRIQSTIQVFWKGSAFVRRMRLRRFLLLAEGVYLIVLKQSLQVQNMTGIRGI